MSRDHDPNGAVRRWLWVVLAMIFAMVIVGGTTRLTGSGLSMVEWRPLMGALPPLSDAEWDHVFAQYQETPQFRQVNHWMGLPEFQRIFFWEYVHRLLGRLIGVVFAAPFAWFLFRRRLTGRRAALASVAFVLGGAQGALGWYMVKSGLVDVPAVSHYRLAAHLMLAFLTGQYVLWLGLELSPHRARAGRSSKALRGLVLATVALLLVQIVYGAFMAGTRAGHVAYTFPDMNGTFSPRPFFPSPSIFDDLFDLPGAIHYVHRALAWLLLAAVAALLPLARKDPHAGVRRATAWLSAAVLMQLILGAATVLLRVPIWLAVVHQGWAFVLLGCATWLCHEAGLLPRGVLAPRGSALPATETPLPDPSRPD